MPCLFNLTGSLEFDVGGSPSLRGAGAARASHRACQFRLRGEGGSAPHVPTPMCSSGGAIMVSCGFSLQVMSFSEFLPSSRCGYGAGSRFSPHGSRWANATWRGCRGWLRPEALCPDLLGSHLVLLIFGPVRAFHPLPLRWGLVPWLLAFVRADCVLGESDMVLSFKQLC